MAISMDEKAANEGDKLKHPLLLEVLARCKGWDSLTYAETHAGAGTYVAANQLESKQHIASLFNLVSGLKDKPREEAAGGRYYRLLQEWWADEAKLGTYPGSVLQAAGFLTNHKIKAQFRVTEAYKDAYDKLVKAVTDYSIKPEHEKFQNKIDWFTEEDSLVLLIDPLGFGEDFGKTPEKKLNKGCMDLPTLTKVLAPCWEKKSVVVLLWLAFGNKGGHVKRGMAYGWLKCLCEQKGASFSCYHANCYYTFIMGIGKGKEVTDQLLQLDWGKSWLPTVHNGL